MNKNLVRCVALVLLPCLIADPSVVLAIAHPTEIWQPGLSSATPTSTSYQALFEQEAIVGSQAVESLVSLIQSAHLSYLHQLGSADVGGVPALTRPAEKILGTATGGFIGYWFDLIYQWLRRRGVRLKTIQTRVAPALQTLFKVAFLGGAMALGSRWQEFLHEYFHTAQPEPGGWILGAAVFGLLAVFLSSSLYGSRHTHPDVYVGANSVPRKATRIDWRKLRDSDRAEGIRLLCISLVGPFFLPVLSEFIPWLNENTDLGISWNPLDFTKAWFGNPWLLGVGMVIGFLMVAPRHGQVNAQQRLTGGIIGAAPQGYSEAELAAMNAKEDFSLVEQQTYFAKAMLWPIVFLMSIFTPFVLLVRPDSVPLDHVQSLSGIPFHIWGGGSITLLLGAIVFGNAILRLQEDSFTNRHKTVAKSMAEHFGIMEKEYQERLARTYWLLGNMNLLLFAATTLVLFFPVFVLLKPIFGLFVTSLVAFAAPFFLAQIPGLTAHRMLNRLIENNPQFREKYRLVPASANSSDAHAPAASVPPTGQDGGHGRGYTMAAIDLRAREELLEHLNTDFTEEEMGEHAARNILRDIKKSIDAHGKAVMLFASAPSQHATWEALIRLWPQSGIDSSKIVAFHMDEYLGLEPNARQLFGKVLRERFFERVGITNVRYFDASIGRATAKRLRKALKRNDPVLADQLARKLENLVRERNAPIIEAFRAEGGRFHVVVGGIGVHPHLAFNDAPDARFDDPEIIKVVRLSETSRRQQVMDKEFDRIEDVATHANTFTLPPIFDADYIHLIVPRPIKAPAVYQTTEGRVGEDIPATGARRPHILPKVMFYFDSSSAAMSRAALSVLAGNEVIRVDYLSEGLTGQDRLERVRELLSRLDGYKPLVDLLKKDPWKNLIDHPLGEIDQALQALPTNQYTLKDKELLRLAYVQLPPLSHEIIQTGLQSGAIDPAHVEAFGQKLRQTLLAVGRHLKNHHTTLVTKTIKEDGSPVTEGDLYAQGQLLPFFLEAAPHTRLIFEERIDDKDLLARVSARNEKNAHSDWVVVIDPIDGSDNYEKEEGQADRSYWMMGVTVFYRGVPILAMGYSPEYEIPGAAQWNSPGSFFEASLFAETTLNGVPVEAAPVDNLIEHSIVMDEVHPKGGEPPRGWIARQPDYKTALAPDIDMNKIDRRGTWLAAGRIAAGKLDPSAPRLIVFDRHKPYDAGAYFLIARAKGGLVLNHQSRDAYPIDLTPGLKSGPFIGGHATAVRTFLGAYARPSAAARAEINLEQPLKDLLPESELMPLVSLYGKGEGFGSGSTFRVVLAKFAAEVNKPLPEGLPTDEPVIIAMADKEGPQRRYAILLNTLLNYLTEGQCLLSHLTAQEVEIILKQARTQGYTTPRIPPATSKRLYVLRAKGSPTVTGKVTLVLSLEQNSPKVSAARAGKKGSQGNSARSGPSGPHSPARWVRGASATFLGVAGAVSLAERTAGVIRQMGRDDPEASRPIGLRQHSDTGGLSSSGSEGYSVAPRPVFVPSTRTDVTAHRPRRGQPISGFVAELKSGQRLRIGVGTLLQVLEVRPDKIQIILEAGGQKLGPEYIGIKVLFTSTLQVRGKNGVLFPFDLWAEFVPAKTERNKSGEEHMSKPKARLIVDADRENVIIAHEPEVDGCYPGDRLRIGEDLYVRVAGMESSAIRVLFEQADGTPIEGPLQWKTEQTWDSTGILKARGTDGREHDFAVRLNYIKGGRAYFALLNTPATVSLVREETLFTPPHAARGVSRKTGPPLLNRDRAPRPRFSTVLDGIPLGNLFGPFERFMRREQEEHAEPSIEVLVDHVAQALKRTAEFIHDRQFEAILLPHELNAYVAYDLLKMAWAHRYPREKFPPIFILPLHGDLSDYERIPDQADQILQSHPSNKDSSLSLRNFRETPICTFDDYGEYGSQYQTLKYVLPTLGFRNVPHAYIVTSGRFAMGPDDFTGEEDANTVDFLRRINQGPLGRAVMLPKIEARLQHLITNPSDTSKKLTQPPDEIGAGHSANKFLRQLEEIVRRALQAGFDPDAIRKAVEEGIDNDNPTGEGGESGAGQSGSSGGPRSHARALMPNGAMEFMSGSLAEPLSVFDRFYGLAAPVAEWTVGRRHMINGGGSYGSGASGDPAVSTLDEVPSLRWEPRTFHFDPSVFVKAFALSPDGRWLAISTDPSDRDKMGKVEIYNVKTGKKVADLQGFADYPSLTYSADSLAFSPDGTKLAAAGGHLNKILCVWKVADTGHCELLGKQWLESNLGYATLTWHPNSKELAIARYRSNAVYTWNVGESLALQPKALKLRKAMGNAHALAYTPDGTALAVSTVAGPIILWRKDGGAWKQIKVFHGARTDRLINSLAFRPEGDYLVATDSTDTFYVCDLHSGHVKTKQVRGAIFSSVAFSPDGMVFTLMDSKMNRSILFPASALEAKEIGAPLAQLVVHPGSETAFFVSFGDAKTLAAAGVGRTIYVWTLPPFDQIKANPASETVTSASFGLDMATKAIEYPLEPFKIKIVETLTVLSRRQRLARLRKASNDVSALTSEDVMIDLETDSGKAAMSPNQFGAWVAHGDEAYAGSRSFRKMEATIREITGFHYVIPTHQGRGAKEVLNQVMLPDQGMLVIGNHIIDTTAGTIEEHRAFAVELPVLDDSAHGGFRGNIDLVRLQKTLNENRSKVAYVLMNVTDNFRGGQPVSMENLKAVRKITKSFNLPFYGDISYFAENAIFIQQREPDYAQKSILDIVHEMMKQFDAVQMSCKKDGLSPSGGFLAMRDKDLYDRAGNYSILAEGYLTYGGISGANMEAIHHGLWDVIDEQHLTYRLGQTHYLADQLKALGVPIFEPVGGHAVLIDVKAFYEGSSELPSAHDLAARLYIESGVRADAANPDFIRLSLPPRVYTQSQLDFVAESLQKVQERLHRREPSGSLLRSFSHPMEPFKIRVIEPTPILAREDRLALIERAGLNLFALDSAEVTIDLLTDSGTGAISQEQLANKIKANASGSWKRLKRSIQKISGFKYVIPVHQGRGAEKVLNAILLSQPGKKVIGNRIFDTTTGHIQFRHAEAMELPIEESQDTAKAYAFKGNIDLNKLRETLEREHTNIAYVLITVTDNSGGGQPVSMENLKAALAIAQEFDLPFFGDIARFAQNASFVKDRESGYAKKSSRAIAREKLGLFDVVQMSSKKDGLAHMGGFLALNDEALYEKLLPVARLQEGEGMSPADMEMLAQGLEEALDDHYLDYRLAQTRYLGEKLKSLGIPIVEPVGGHAVFIDAEKFLPQIPPEQFPAQALGVELYIEGGVRPVEIGSLLAGRHEQGPQAGENRMADHELLRLTLPSRVYTQSHLDYVAECVKRVYDRRNQIRGLEFTQEPPILRHFTARFKWVGSSEERGKERTSAGVGTGGGQMNLPGPHQRFQSAKHSHAMSLVMATGPGPGAHHARPEQDKGGGESGVVADGERTHSESPHQNTLSFSMPETPVNSISQQSSAWIQVRRAGGDLPSLDESQRSSLAYWFNYTLAAGRVDPQELLEKAGISEPVLSALREARENSALTGDNIKLIARRLGELAGERLIERQKKNELTNIELAVLTEKLPDAVLPPYISLFHTIHLVRRGKTIPPAYLHRYHEAIDKFENARLQGINLADILARAEGNSGRHPATALAPPILRANQGSKRGQTTGRTTRSAGNRVMKSKGIPQALYEAAMVLWDDDDIQFLNPKDSLQTSVDRDVLTLSVKNGLVKFTMEHRRDEWGESQYFVNIRTGALFEPNSPNGWVRCDKQTGPLSDSSQMVEEIRKGLERLKEVFEWQGWVIDSALNIPNTPKQRQRVREEIMSIPERPDRVIAARSIMRRRLIGRAEVSERRGAQGQKPIFDRKVVRPRLSVELPPQLLPYYNYENTQVITPRVNSLSSAISTLIRRSTTRSRSEVTDLFWEIRPGSNNKPGRLRNTIKILVDGQPVDDLNYSFELGQTVTVKIVDPAVSANPTGAPVGKGKGLFDAMMGVFLGTFAVMSGSPMMIAIAAGTLAVVALAVVLFRSIYRQMAQAKKMTAGERTVFSIVMTGGLIIILAIGVFLIGSLWLMYPLADAVITVSGLGFWLLAHQRTLQYKNDLKEVGPTFEQLVTLTPYTYKGEGIDPNAREFSEELSGGSLKVAVAIFRELKRQKGLESARQRLVTFLRVALSEYPVYAYEEPDDRLVHSHYKFPKQSDLEGRLRKLRREGDPKKSPEGLMVFAVSALGFVPHDQLPLTGWGLAALQVAATACSFWLIAHIAQRILRRFPLTAPQSHPSPAVWASA